MDLKDILSVGLTAEDFDLLLKGLDAIPEAESSSSMSLELLKILMSPTKVHADQSVTKFEKKMAELRKLQDAKKEDYIVLKSKLILLKRLLSGNEAVRMANDLLTPPIQIVDYQYKNFTNSMWICENTIYLKNLTKN